VVLDPRKRKADAPEVEDCEVNGKIPRMKK
jgi:hypothetical protein